MRSRKDKPIDRLLLDRWRRAQDETKHHWEDRRVLEDHPEEVIAGLNPLRTIPHHEKSSDIQLLDHGQRGRSTRLVTSGLGAGFPTEPQTILEISSDTKNTRAISVILGVRLPGEAIQVLPAPPIPHTGIYRRIEGILEWGCAGVTVIANVDWLTGTILSLPASFLRVSAFLLPFVGPAAPDEPIVSAFAGYGSVATNRARTPQLTRRVFVLAAGATQNFPVPAFAQNLVVLRQLNGGAPPISTAMTIEFNDETGVTLYGEVFAAGALATVPIDLPNSCRSIDLTNDDGALARNFVIIWGLAL